VFQDYGDQQNRQTAIGPPAPNSFPFSRKKWQQNKKRDSDYWPMRRAGVSIEGGKYDSKPYIHRKK